MSEVSSARRYKSLETVIFNVVVCDDMIFFFFLVVEEAIISEKVLFKISFSWLQYLKRDSKEGSVKV